MRVALLHHWFISLAGGERVFDTIASIFPNADIFTLFLDEQKLPPSLRKHKITTSVLDKIPVARRVHRHVLPFYPLAVEMLDLSGYDLVITSDSGPMKGVVTDPSATHICYCHSPMRYVWDGYSAYARQMSPLTRAIFGLTSHYVRNWDYAAAKSGSLYCQFQLCGRGGDPQVLPERQHHHSPADQYLAKLLDS